MNKAIDRLKKGGEMNPKSEESSEDELHLLPEEHSPSVKVEDSESVDVVESSEVDELEEDSPPPSKTKS